MRSIPMARLSLCPMKAMPCLSSTMICKASRFQIAWANWELTGIHLLNAGSCSITVSMIRPRIHAGFI